MGWEGTMNEVMLGFGGWGSCGGGGVGETRRMGSFCFVWLCGWSRVLDEILRYGFGGLSFPGGGSLSLSNAWDEGGAAGIEW